MKERKERDDEESILMVIGPGLFLEVCYDTHRAPGQFFTTVARSATP